MHTLLSLPLLPSPSPSSSSILLLTGLPLSAPLPTFLFLPLIILLTFSITRLMIHSTRPEISELTISLLRKCSQSSLVPSWAIFGASAAPSLRCLRSSPLTLTRNQSMQLHLSLNLYPFCLSFSYSHYRLFQSSRATRSTRRSKIFLSALIKFFQSASLMSQPSENLMNCLTTIALYCTTACWTAQHSNSVFMLGQSVQLRHSK